MIAMNMRPAKKICGINPLFREGPCNNARERIQQGTPYATLRILSRSRGELKSCLRICRIRLTRFAKGASYHQHATRSNLPGNV